MSLFPTSVTQMVIRLLANSPNAAWSPCSQPDPFDGLGQSTCSEGGVDGCNGVSCIVLRRMNELQDKSTADKE